MMPGRIVRIDGPSWRFDAEPRRSVPWFPELQISTNLAE